MIMVGLLTGHIALNRHVTVMKIRADPLCTACEEDETLYHFLGRCSASMMIRYSIFGAYLVELEELRKVKPATLFAVGKNLKEVFITFGYIWDAHWAALDWPQCRVLRPPAPKVKVKIKVITTFF